MDDGMDDTTEKQLADFKASQGEGEDSYTNGMKNRPAKLGSNINTKIADFCRVSAKWRLILTNILIEGDVQNTLKHYQIRIPVRPFLNGFSSLQEKIMTCHCWHLGIFCIGTKFLSSPSLKNCPPTPFQLRLKIE
jgi:hypothetical protein